MLGVQLSTTVFLQAAEHRDIRKSSHLASFPLLSTTIQLAAPLQYRAVPQTLSVRELGHLIFANELHGVPELLIAGLVKFEVGLDLLQSLFHLVQRHVLRER